MGFGWMALRWRLHERYSARVFGGGAGCWCGGDICAALKKPPIAGGLGGGLGGTGVAGRAGGVGGGECVERGRRERAGRVVPSRSAVSRPHRSRETLRSASRPAFRRIAGGAQRRTSTQPFLRLHLR